MSMMKIKKGDTVKVIAGKDKDKEGKGPFCRQKERQGRCGRREHGDQACKALRCDQDGGIVQKEAALDVSNVMYVHNGKPTRIGFKFENDKKVRYAKSTGEVIE